jgi:uncharacterized Zn-binding protein involved in type VI secretion
MAPAVVRIGDSGSHGGSVSSGSDNVLCNGRGVARVGDTYDCPIHGPNKIDSGSPDTFANSKQIARVGDATECGASLTEGSPDTFCN